MDQWWWLLIQRSEGFSSPSPICPGRHDRALSVGAGPRGGQTPEPDMADCHADTQEYRQGARNKRCGIRTTSVIGTRGLHQQRHQNHHAAYTAGKQRAPEGTVEHDHARQLREPQDRQRICSSASHPCEQQSRGCRDEYEDDPLDRRSKLEHRVVRVKEDDHAEHDRQASASCRGARAVCPERPWFASSTLLIPDAMSPLIVPVTLCVRGAARQRPREQRTRYPAQDTVASSRGSTCLSSHGSRERAQAPCSRLSANLDYGPLLFKVLGEP